MDCPPLDALLDYSRQVLVPAESVQIAGHLQAGCRACWGNVGWLGEVVELTARDRSFDFSEDLIQGMVAWFKAQPVPSVPTLRKLVAQLIFDSLLPQQAAPVRGEAESSYVSPATGRQMLFQAEGYDVDLRFEAIEDETNEDLIGQVLPQNQTQSLLAGVIVELWQAEQTPRKMVTDQYGLFRFANIPSGVYDLKIQVVEGEISLHQVATARRAAAG